MRFSLILLPLVALSLVGCGNRDHSRAEAAYASAVKDARAKLKIPKSAYFPPFKAEVEPSSNDSLPIINVDGDSVEVMLVGRTAHVEGYYEAQNSFGVFVPGHFTALMVEDTVTGEWRTVGGAKLEREK